MHERQVNFNNVSSDGHHDHPGLVWLRLTVLTVLLVLVMGVAYGQAVNRPGAVLDRIFDGHEVGDFHQLPTAGGLVAFNLDGQLYIMSKNGRFLFDGRLRDTWHNGRSLNSMADIEAYALRLDLDGMGLDFSQLVTINLGTGAQRATLFVSGDCPACEQAVNQALQLPDTYGVRVVVIPRDKTVGGARAVDCAVTTADKMTALKALYDDSVTTPPTPKNCDDSMAHLLSTTMAARVIGIDRIPFVVAPDGRVSHGLPDHGTLQNFIAGTEASE